MQGPRNGLTRPVSVAHCPLIAILPSAFSFKLRCGIILPTLSDPDLPNNPHTTT
jgi:hypothetical protein